MHRAALSYVAGVRGADHHQVDVGDVSGGQGRAQGLRQSARVHPQGPSLHLQQVRVRVRERGREKL